MKRRWKVLIAALVALAALLAVNTAVLDSETKPAEVNAPGGELIELDAATLQVVDSPAGVGPAREGAPIVLLHCYACSLRWWDALVPLLNRRHRVLRFDLIGFGGSQKPKSGYAITEQARAVAEALNRLQVEGAILVGHSMGGDVATAVAEAASQLVDRVAVIGTPSSEDEAELPLSARFTYAPVLGEALWRIRPDALIRDGYGSAFAPGFDFEAAFEDPDQAVVDNRAMTYTSFDQPPGLADDFTGERAIAPRITATAVPFMAILGAEDQIVDTPAAAESYATVPGASVEVLEEVGHSPGLEAPEQTARLLLRFSAGAPSPAELAAEQARQERQAARAAARERARERQAKRRKLRRERKRLRQAVQRAGKRSKGGKVTDSKRSKRKKQSARKQGRGENGENGNGKEQGSGKGGG